MILYKKDEFIYYDFETGNPDDKAYGNDLKVNFFDAGANIIKIIIDIKTGHDFYSILTRRVPAIEVKDRDGVAYGTTLEEVIFGFNKGTDVNNQDQTTDDVIARFNKVSHGTTLASAGSINDKTITLTNATGAAPGKYIVLFYPESERFTPFFQVGEAVGNVITLDSRLDFDYPAGTFVDLADTNMAVDGSVTAQTFGLRGIGAPPGVDIEYDQTRIIISCLTASAVDLAKFGDLDVLDHGLEFRLRNKRYHNSFNVKSNREIDAIFGTDWKPYSAQNLQQGQHGFTARLTFAGMDKVGVAKRLPIGDDYEITVQDNLLAAQSGRQILLLEVISEGHVTEP